MRLFCSIRYTFVFILLTGMLSCESPKKDFASEEAVLLREIGSRLKSLDSSSAVLKEKGIDPAKMHSDIQQLLLASKDVENIQASVNLSNRFFEEQFAKYEFNTSMLVKLNADMGKEGISLALKQNELNLLNQIQLQNLDKQVELKSAY